LSEQAPQPQPQTQPPPQTKKPFYAQTRVKIALGIAVFEGLLVAVSHDWSKWTVIVVAIPIILFYLLAGRTLDSSLGREISWVAAASQALAVVLVLLWYWIELLTFIAIGVFAAIVLYLLFVDRPSEKAS
jgi:FtsH-binding integral membrane protein